MELDTHFWEAVCFIIFVLLAYKPAKTFIINYLNDHSKKIQENIQTSEDLRAESEKIIEFYQGQHKKFSKQVEDIHKNTEANIKKITDTNNKRLEENIKTKTELHKEKLYIYEKEQTNKIKLEAVTKALLVVQSYLNDHRQRSISKQQIDETLNMTKNKKIVLH
jgi:F-type H+-transporting ATPase subunit b